MSEATVTVTSDLGEEIVRQEHGKYSSEGHAPHNRDAAQAEAEAVKPETQADPEDDAAFHDAFQDAIESTKPLLTDKDRIAQEDREQARQDREEQVKAEAEGQESEEGRGTGRPESP
jgi:hypothetical protein